MALSVNSVFKGVCELYDLPACLCLFSRCAVAMCVCITTKIRLPMFATREAIEYG